MNAKQIPEDCTFNEERRMLALECTWETDALLEALLGLTEPLGGAEHDQGELMTKRYQCRALITRLGDLNKTAMSIIDGEHGFNEMSKLVRRYVEPSVEPEQGGVQ